MNVAYWGIVALAVGAILALLWARTAIRNPAVLWAKVGRIVAGTAIIALMWRLIATIAVALNPNAALPFSFATAAGLNVDAHDVGWQVVVSQQHDGHAQVIAELGQPRFFLVSQFTQATMNWVATVSLLEILMWIVCAVVVFALADDVIRRHGFTIRTQIVATVASVLVVIMATVREVASSAATSGIYAEMEISNFTVQSQSITWTYFALALAIAVVRSLITAGVRNANDVDGLI